MIDLIALSAAKKHADLLAMGLTSVSVDNTNKSITFTLAADGSQHTIYFDQPSDGVSIIGVEIKNGHLICLMSDGSEIDAGVLPSGGSGGSVPKPLTYDYMPEGYPKKILTQKDLIEQQTMEFGYDPDFGASGTVAFGLEEPITGGKYKVTINDKTYETIAKPVTYQGVTFHVLGNGKAAGLEDTGESFGCFWYPQMMQIYIYENISQAIVGISGDDYDVVSMVPEFVGGAYDSAVIPTGVETILWDGTIDGNSDTFVWNGWHYYLVSNLIPSVSQLERSKIDDFEPFEVVQGTNACGIDGDCIVVYSRGTCSLPVHDGDIAQTFYAEKPGIYMIKLEEGYPIKLEIPVYLKVPQIYGIIIKSSNSEKLFKITVDDTGTLSATEVTT